MLQREFGVAAEVAGVEVGVGVVAQECGGVTGPEERAEGGGKLLMEERKRSNAEIG